MRQLRPLRRAVVAFLCIHFNEDGTFCGKSGRMFRLVKENNKMQMTTIPGTTAFGADDDHSWCNACPS